MRLKKTLRGLALASACVLLGTSSLAPTPAWAVNRTIPANTVLVKVAPHTTHTLIVNGKEAALASGARIYTDTNRTIVPGRVPEGAAARVQFNAHGDISAVWLLSAEEAARDTQ